MTVSVDDGSAVESVATLAPAVIAQILIFLASLYFFVATRHDTRTAILKLCFSRRLRWRTAHIFRDVETFVSRYLLSITVINVSEGVAVGAGLYLVGVQSAILWGALAAVANFIIFLGPLSMTILLFGVGLTEFDTFGGALIPPLVYQSINLIEQQFVTPLVIGRTMTMNPFVVVLALIFWIWLWGPLGGFIAIPALLIVYAIIRNIVPGADWLEPPARADLSAGEQRRQTSGRKIPASHPIGPPSSAPRSRALRNRRRARRSACARSACAMSCWYGPATGRACRPHAAG